MSKILLTGATGLLGSGLVPSLLKRGHEVVCLVRPQGDESVVERLHKTFGSCERLTAVAGDVTLPLGGVSGEHINVLRGKIDKVVHCAASVKFDEAVSGQTWKTNVGGTENVLLLATRLGIHEFHYMSTIYVAGDSQQFSEEDFDIGQTCRNPYEFSKMVAEQLVRGWDGRYSIYRLGVIVGDSRTGEISDFDGYYGFLLPFWRLRQMIEQKWEKNGENYQREGIEFALDGSLCLPLRISFSPHSTINLIPIDWSVAMLTNLIEISADNKVFHLADPHPVVMKWGIETCLSLLGITGFKCADGSEKLLPPLLKKLQAGLDKALERYLPYTTHEVKPILRNTERVLDGQYSPPPKIDKRFFAKLLDFAKSVNFGKGVE